MPIITKIKPQKNKKRVNIYLDNKFGFGLDLESFIKLGLKVEQEVSEIKIKELLVKAEFQKTLDKILRFAALRPRSKKEINDWFRKHKVHLSLHKDLFNRLRRLELLDDAKFAKWWVEQRMNFRPKARRVIKYELRKKGIDINVIEDVLSEIKIDEGKIAKEILDKKKYKWEKLPKLEARRKMNEFLGRKGFGWEIIKASVDEVLEQ